jgi:hypothetical protein
MAWIIDFDVHPDKTKKAPCNSNATGLRGPDGYTGDGSELSCQFRMLDGDGEIYYFGRNSSCDDNDAFGPLDDFGVRNAGCVKIEYYNGETWEVL